ncbi:S-receptor-like serine/threonine-protein kinase [Parasponia andersonii]|uniref:Receptor-like serine/threonine-protein kinase n=1 Tax=Parasponia andersonii TaxID=3476 RepID=A0A2P5BW77_PARAD|nr:S-receptor-like serine/threonine-protein kinase [Parasponia andersonii]
MLSLAFISLACLVLFSNLDFSIAADTVTPSQVFTVNDTLVSSGKTFELGLFSLESSSYWYLGIWYKDFPDIIVWVANRENPLEDSFGKLTISGNGNLLLSDRNNNIIWSTNSSGKAQEPLAQLLESGNFVIRDKASTSTDVYVWQSFSFPSNTLLAGMKIGWNLKIGQNLFLTSWRNTSDPSLGRFTYGIDNFELPQLVLRNGSEKLFRSGLWNGIRFSGVHSSGNPFIRPIFVFNSTDLYYAYETNDTSVMTRFTITELGSLQRLVLIKGSSDWSVIIGKSPVCECLKGFVPKSAKAWEMLNWRSGCVRKTRLDCKKKVGFMKLENLKLPDILDFRLNKSMSLKECEAECLKNCSCTAYASSDIASGDRGCLMWFGELLDIREFVEDDSKQYIYVKMLATDLELMGGSGMFKRLVLTLVIPTVSVVLLGLACCCIIWKCRRKRSGIRESEEDLELPLFDFHTVSAATDNFSWRNKLGEGGFGQVYKGNLLMQQDVAVKRLSNNSGQGFCEFKNEVTMIAKLQHRNLVKLLGYCTEGEERILIYEYMANKSLNRFIFDDNKRVQLNWQKRFDIIMGIARGLLYLHQDSRVRIIHRDLKTSNILLDSELNPKISDFGIARIFGGNQMEAKTKRVIGTYGYMSPEYAIDGKFSTKSDVFSLGVLFLEILSGKRNRCFKHPDHHHNLLGHAWIHWNEKKAIELMDQCLEDSYVEPEVLRCIQVGLLCVQKLPNDRPAMSSVVLMLSTEGPILPQPKQPGFFTERSSLDDEPSIDREGYHTENALTVTVVEAR